MMNNNDEKERVSVCALIVDLVDNATNYSKRYEYKVPGEGAELAYAAGFISASYRSLGKKVASRRVPNCKSMMYIAGFGTSTSAEFDEKKLYEQIKGEIACFQAEVKAAAIAQAQAKASRAERKPRI